MIFIQNARSTEYGGGFLTRKRLRVANSSAVSLQNVIAQEQGGGFLVLGEVEIAGNSTVKISNSRAESRDGGGFDTEKGLKGLQRLKDHHSQCDSWKAWRRILCQRQDLDQQVHSQHRRCHGAAVWWGVLRI